MADKKLKVIRKQEKYLERKINGHGGSWCTNGKTGRVKTDYVGLKNKFQIFLINIKLWFIWITNKE